MHAKGTHPPSPDPELTRLQQKWSPEWLVWRSRNSAGEPNEWCATRHGEGGEYSRTLMEPTAERLEAALRDQAERGAPTPTAAYPA
jgi:hypothetical protein